MTDRAKGCDDGGQSLPDLTPLASLMRLAGPQAGQELLARLHDDLAKAATGLDTAIATADPALLRSVTHVLIAVAGAVGDTALSDTARALNAATAANPGLTDHRLCDQVKTGLQALRKALPPLPHAETGTWL